mgnify:CR=1 FL=1
MAFSSFSKFVLISFTLLLCSCSKGYDVRFVNYYTEAMDSVIIGNKTIVFTNVAPEKETDFRHLKRGQYKFTCISHSGKHFSSEFFIPGNGSGKRTIQIDAIAQLSVLEE